MTRLKNFSYAWVVFISLIFLKLGVGGAIYGITGNFVAPVVRELGCTVSQFTMVVSIQAAVMAFMYTTAARVIKKKKIGRVMGLATLVQVLGVAWMGTCQRVELFYLSGVVIGVGASFTSFVTIPIVVDMWFQKRAGLVLGLIVAAENIATILYSLLTAELIVRCGWRLTYLLIAAISLFLSAPAAFFLIKTPGEAGCPPYGAETQEKEKKAEPVWGMTKKEAVRNPVFYLVWIIGMCYSISYSVQQYIAAFATMELGQSIAYGARAAAYMSFGFIISSMMLGFINDRFGAKAGLGYGAMCILLGYGLMTLSIRVPSLCILAALIVGFGGSMYTVQCPLITRMVLGSKDYSSIWSFMMMGNSMIGALSFSLVGLFYDWGGSYRGAFFMAISLYIIAFIVGSAAIRMGKRLR